MGNLDCAVRSTRDVGPEHVAPVSDGESGSLSPQVVRDAGVVLGVLPLLLHRLVGQVQVVELVEGVVFHQVVQVLLHHDLPHRRVVVVSVEVEVRKSRLHFWAIAVLKMK